jgi:hypothetical protein
MRNVESTPACKMSRASLATVLAPTLFRHGDPSAFLRLAKSDVRFTELLLSAEPPPGPDVDPIQLQGGGRGGVGGEGRESEGEKNQEREQAALEGRTELPQRLPQRPAPPTAAALPPQPLAQMQAAVDAAVAPQARSGAVDATMYNSDEGDGAAGGEGTPSIYRVLRKTVVRAAAELDSPTTGIVQAHAVVVVEARKMTTRDAGREVLRLRLRGVGVVPAGWVSVVAADGRPIMEPIAGGDSDGDVGYLQF